MEASRELSREFKSEAEELVRKWGVTAAKEARVSTCIADLKLYRLQKIGEGSIKLGVGEPEPLIGPTDVGTGKADDERVKLSSLIEQLNERFGTDFTPADQLFFHQVQADALQNDYLNLAATANNIDDFKLKFDKELEGLFIDRMDGNAGIFRRLMSDENFRSVASEWLMNEVYQRASESGVGDSARGVGG